MNPDRIEKNLDINKLPSSLNEYTHFESVHKCFIFNVKVSDGAVELFIALFFSTRKKIVYQVE